MGTRVKSSENVSPAGSGSDDLDDGDSLDFLMGLDELFPGSGDSLLFWGPQPSEEPRLPVEVHTHESVAVATAARQPAALAPVTKSSPPKRKNSTQRQKEEMQYLRSKVEELEDHLRVLKRKREEDLASNPLGLQRSDGVWEEVAKRQSTERVKADQEQRSLRSMLKSQIKLTRGIESLLGDPMVWDQLQKENWRDANGPHKGDMEVFADMLQSIELSRVQLDSHFDFAKSLINDRHFKETLELKSASIDGLCFEAKCVCIMPFNFDTVRETGWNALRQGGLTAPDDKVTVVMASNEFVLNKLCSTAPPIVPEPTIAYQAVKRFPGNKCEYIISEFMATVSGSPLAKSPPFQMLSRSWGRLSPHALDDGHPASMMEEHITSVITLLKPENESEVNAEHYEIDILVRLLASIHKEKRAAIGQVIENRLVDAALSTRITE